MRIMEPGRMSFAAGMIGLGVISLFSADFAADWQPVPHGLPLRGVLACCSDALLVAAGTGLFTRRWAAVSAGILTAYLFFWLLVLHGIQVAQAPLQEGSWEISGETALFTAGAWVLFASLAQRPRGLGFFTGAGGVRAAGLLLGLGLLPIGLSHFVYAHGSIGYVPAWLPDRPAWVYITGAAHAAAGLALIFRVLPRLAAGMEAAMLLIITLLVNIPRVYTVPQDHSGWIWLFADLTSTASAWLVADSYRGTGWLTMRPRR